MTELERIAEEDKQSAARAEAMQQALREMRGMWDELQNHTTPTQRKGVTIEKPSGSERSKRGLSVKFHLTPEEFPRDEVFRSEDLSSTAEAAGYSSEEAVGAAEGETVRSPVFTFC